MLGNHKARLNYVRVFALALAVVSILFAAQLVSHSHAKGQNEATCQICQTAQIGSSPIVGTEALVDPFFAIGYVQPFVATIHQQFFFHDSPSRAPPSA